MSAAWLAWRSITRGGYRSVAIGACALVIAGMALFTSVVAHGTRASLQAALARLGADIVVVPQGSETRVESALVMGTSAQAWMPRANLEKIAAIPGVAAVSPQLYLSSLYRASCCSVSEMFLVAYDPGSDFALRPWLTQGLSEGLGDGEAVGGSNVFVPEGEAGIRLYGSLVRLRGHLAPTGTNLDRSLFFTFDTARAIAAASYELAERPLEIPPDSVSAVLVKVQPGADAHGVALEVLRRVPGAVPVQSPDLFRTYSAQTQGLGRVLSTYLGTTAVLSLGLMALLFTLFASGRRREIGVLRALGVRRGQVILSFMAEAGLLALGGATLGAGLAGLGVYLFRELIARSLGLPFLFPGPGALLAVVGTTLALALTAAALAALLPILRIAGQEPALAMRE